MFGFGKKSYKVIYECFGICRTTYIKARNITDIQKKLERKEYPFYVTLLEVTQI